MIFTAKDGSGRLVGLVFVASKKEALSCEEFALLGDKVVSALGLFPKTSGLLQIGDEKGFAQQGLNDRSGRRFGGKKVGKRQRFGGQNRSVRLAGFGGKQLQGKKAGLAFLGGAQLADKMFGIGFGLRNQGLEAAAKRGFNGGEVFVGA